MTKYIISFPKDLYNLIDEQLFSTTNTSLRVQPQDTSITFYDSYKSEVKYNQILKDVNGIYPPYTRKPCWWCRHPFQTSPLGCPLKFIPQPDEELKAERLNSYFETYNIKNDGDGVFEAEGIFCSFPCLKSYILSEISITCSSVYKESLTLLSLLYKFYYGKNAIIPVAGDWRIIQPFGPKTIEEFRKQATTHNFTRTLNVRRPYLFSSQFYIEESSL